MDLHSGLYGRSSYAVALVYVTNALLEQDTLVSTLLVSARNEAGQSRLVHVVKVP